jgi:hypothetical protein
LPGLFAFVLSLSLSAPATPQPEPGCTFQNGVTTCVTVSQSQDQQTVTMVSGCLYGPEGVPGRRERVFLETWLITATTTTYAKGVNGPIYDSSTTVTRDLLSSTQVSDTCYPQ